MHLLNHRKPEHPPDIYFIRRNEKMLNRYLEPTEMEFLVKEAPLKSKQAYKLFELNPTEKDIIRKINHQKRNFLNPADPFYSRANKAFRKRYTSLYKTERYIKEISPRDHTSWLNKTKPELVQWSKQLNSTMCDREHVYYRPKSPDGNNTKN